jgi:hypothetical protein
MRDHERTTCPCCGAPAILTEAQVRDHPFDGFLRSKVYKYEPDASTMMGYDLRHLRIVAELLREYNFTPQDLREIELNLETALGVARAECEKAHQRMLNEALSHFQAPPIHIEAINLEPILDKEGEKDATV